MSTPDFSALVARHRAYFRTGATRSTVWREGHDAVSATLVVRYHGTAYPRLAEDPPGHVKTVQPVPIEDVVAPAPRKKPQLLPMSAGRTPDVFHGVFSPDSVGLWTFRVDAWSDPWATWRHAVTVKLNAGQGPDELANDLEVGARDGELLVRLRIHEVDVGAVVVEELDVLRLGVHARELLTRAKRAVDDRPRVQALQLRAERRGAAAPDRPRAGPSGARPPR